MRPIVDIVGDVVDAVSTKWLADYGETVKYYYGHPVEIVNRFSQMVSDVSAKAEIFPAICLMMDFEEERNVDGYDAKATLSMVIMVSTNPAYISEERYAANFIPTLYPLYDLFIEKLEASTELAVEKGSDELPLHTKIDRLYWGKEGLYGNTANIFNDFIDAIEIKDLTLKIFKT